MRSYSRALILCAVLFFVPFSYLPISTSANGGDWNPSNIIISEILASPQGENYGGSDLNGDGDISSDSDQYIELWNPTSEPIDISNWWLDDDPTGGSQPCSIGWNTTIEPDARIAFFRDRTGIALDYWPGDTVQLRLPDHTIIDSVTYPAEDSDYNYSYARDFQNNGELYKINPPTPGYEEGGSPPTTALDWGRCYTPRDNVHEGSYILTGRIVKMTSQEDVIPNGSILVRDGMIDAVWKTGDAPLGVNLDGVPTHHTGATIYPGLIDMHNHLHYNTAPLWNMTTHLPESQRSEWGGYTNRGQWKYHDDYKADVSWVKTFLTGGDKWDMQSETLKYAEFKEIVGGTTSAQGAPSSNKDGFDSILTRNIELYNFNRDNINTCAVCDAGSDSSYNGDHLINNEYLEGWFIHLAEGVDDESLEEFSILKEQGLLLPETIIIHGVPLGESEFNEMAEVGSSLVWSPTSNLLLYGNTGKVDLAKKAGVNIALAPDWSPSGTKSPLHELKVADLWDEEILGDVFSNYEMVQMVTTNAVDAMNWTGDVGRISPGLNADFVVIDSFDEDPYRNLIDAVDPDVRLTIVGGLALFGDVDLMTSLNGNDWEFANITDWGGTRTFEKALDATFLAVEDGAQSWAQIVSNLEMAMRFDHDEMFEHFGNRYDDRADFDSSFVSGTYRDLVSVPLDPIYTWGDQRYFEVLNYSVSANAQIDMSVFYNLWYSAEMNNDGNRNINFEWQSDDTFENTTSGGATGGTGEGNQGWFCPFTDEQICSECPNGDTCSQLIYEQCQNSDDYQMIPACESFVLECKFTNWLGESDSLCNQVLEQYTNNDSNFELCPFSNNNNSESLCLETQDCSANLDTCAKSLFDAGLTCGNDIPSELSAICSALGSIEPESTSHGEVDWTNLPCSPGQIKAPDAVDCRYCVCTTSGAWTCNDDQCSEENAADAKSSEGGMDSMGTVGGILAVAILLGALILIERNRGNKQVDGWDKPPVIIEETKIPELPPMGPPPDEDSAE